MPTSVILARTPDADHPPAAEEPKRHRTWRAVGGVVLALFAIALVAAAIVVGVYRVRVEPVLSGSMRPGIQPGDVAVLVPVPVASLHPGEVIAYLPPNQSVPVMHRIVSITSAGVITKGDANPTPDPWGRVRLHQTSVEHLVSTIPKIGWITAVREQLLVVCGFVLVGIAAIAFGTGMRRHQHRPPESGQLGSGSPSGAAPPPSEESPASGTRER